jgi:DNA-binding SARP family transcriptional activator/tetratricopeptide (TPR) repeat protein
MPMEPRLKLRCLGEPVLSGPDGEPIRFKVRKHLALLVFLAVEAASRHHRDQLAELLWANLPEGDNRHSLATALSMIRTRVGADAVEADRDHVRFNRGCLDLDLDRLEAGDVLASEFQPALDIAGFLDGFEVPGSPEFMLWRERQRSRWLPLVRDALVKRIDKCRRTGDFKQIEHLADRMLGLDELSEEAVRAKMEARAFAGDRLGALKVFEAWKERLEEDLGASPSALVEGMAIRLRRRGWERPPTSQIALVHTDQWKNRAFVGRGVEYQAVYEGWERTRAGQPGHAMLLGDSGIGKSTVADRLATAAGLEGAATARVQCYEIEREIPYATIAGLVHGLLNQPGASATPPEALAELARTVPEVRQKYPAIPIAADSQGETARILLTEAFHQLLTALAEEQPVILVVDDLHLADDASLAVLHLMMRRARGQPIMVLFATRLEGVDQSPQASRLRESADRLGVRIIELGRMNDDESAELLASFIPADEEQPGAAARRALLRAAAGYPMVLELLVQDWRANGVRSMALSVEAMTEDPAVASGPDGTYRQLLERLTGSLDQPTRNVLNLASILGSRLNDLSAYALADLSVGQTMSGMAQLVRLRILRERGDGLEFANELIRAHAYVRVPSPLRRALHGEIAGRLLTEAADGMPRSGLEIAWHCFRGGRASEGIPYLLSGASEALRRGAPHEVELALTSAMPALNGSDVQTAQVLLAETIQEQGRWLDSLRVLDNVRREGGSGDLVDVLTTWAHFKLMDVSDDNVDASLEQLRSIVESTKAPDLAVRALMTAAYVLYDLRNSTSARVFLALASDIDQARLDEEHRLRLVLARALLANQLDYTNRMFDELLLAAESLPRSNLASLAAVQVLQGSASVRCSRGEYELALADAMLGHKMALRLGNDAALATAAGNLALCYGRLGSYQAQVDWSEKGLQYLGNRFTGYRDIQLGFARAFGNAMLGRIPAAISALSEAGARIPPTIPKWMRQAWRFERADVLQMLGKRREALIEAAEALEDQELHSNTVAGPFARWLAHHAIATGEVTAARKRLQEFRSKLEMYDAVDQAEILAAACWLDVHSGISIPAARLRAQHRRLTERLLALPSAVGVQLSRLSVLPPAS